jgi:hypothetical protein
MSWTHMSDTMPKARKPHRCYLCGEAIEIGESHVHRTGKRDGHLCSDRFHVECEAETRSWDDTSWTCMTFGDMERPRAERGES